MNSDIAYLIGKIMGDGHLEKTLGSCYFISSIKPDLIIIKDFILNNFDISPAKINLIEIDKNNNSYKLRINNTKFCKFLHSYGAPKGKKTDIEFYLPDWIINNKENTKLFLQALLEDELSTIKIKRANHSNDPRLKMAKKKYLIDSHKVFMNQIRDCIQSFSITCSNLRIVKTRNESTLDIYFRIHGNKRNIIRFKDNIGFRFNQAKIAKLEECYKILKKTLKPLINKEEIYDLHKQGLSLRKIGSKLGIGYNTVHRILKKKPYAL